MLLYIHIYFKIKIKIKKNISRVWIHLPSKNSDLNLVNGHFSTQFDKTSTFLRTVCSDIDDDNIFREFLIRQTFWWPWRLKKNLGKIRWAKNFLCLQQTYNGLKWVNLGAEAWHEFLTPAMLYAFKTVSRWVHFWRI